jgi:hypothetical protein
MFTSTPKICTCKKNEKKNLLVGSESPKCEVNGSCIRAESREYIDRCNRKSAIHLLKTDLLPGTHDRLSRKASDLSEINQILRMMEKHKLSPERDFGITDFLQYLVNRKSPLGGLNRLSKVQIQNLIGSPSDNPSETPDVEGKQKSPGGKRKLASAMPVVRKSFREKKGTQHEDYHYAN